MKKVIITIPGAGDYHCPDINFDQLDHLVNAFPEVMRVIQMKEFSIDSPGHWLYAVIQLLKGAPFKTLAAILLVPVGQDFWEEKLFEENMKVVGRLPNDVLYTPTRNEDKTLKGIKPGRLLDAFFGAVPILGEAFASFDFSTIAPPPPTPESVEDSVVTQETSD